MSSFEAELAAALDKSKRLGLSFYILGGMVYIQDGGKRGLCGDDGCTYCCGESMRKASEEEVELWESLR